VLVKRVLVTHVLVKHV